MQLKITFLGTSSAQPTKERSHSAVALALENETLLFDCGEGVQRQIKLIKLKPSKIKRIFLTHWHGDHVLGLPGLIQTFGLNKREDELNIYGPIGTKQRFDSVMHGFAVNVSFKTNIHECKLKDCKLVDTDIYEVFATSVKHPVPCIAFSFVEKPVRRMNMAYLKKIGLIKHPLLKQLQHGKDIIWEGKKVLAEKATYVKQGKKISYVVDASVTSDVINLIKDSDVLICEATFAGEMKDSAEEFGHMTAKDAAGLAKKANAKKLIITHFSARYKNVTPLLDEAKQIFKNTIAARDFLEVNV